MPVRLQKDFLRQIRGLFAVAGEAETPAGHALVPAREKPVRFFPPAGRGVVHRGHYSERPACRSFLLF
jgi:hypothetical protein